MSGKLVPTRSNGLEPLYDSHLSVWKCPVCGFWSKSKEEVEAHIKAKHPQKPTQKEAQKSKPSKSRFRVGDTTIEVVKRPSIQIKDQSGWRFFLTANYIATLHKKKVRVKLITGEEFEGLLKAKDPYFVGLSLDDGRKLYINKAHILWVEPIH